MANRSFLTYYGGKVRMSSKIIDLMPEHDVYVEPFVGGGAILYNKPPCKIEWINDINDNIVSFYRVFQDNEKYKHFKRRLDNTLYSETEYKTAKDIYKGKIEATEIDKAWAVFVLACISFSSQLGGGFRYSTKKELPQVFYNKKLAIPLMRDRLKNVGVMNKDALDVIKKLDSERTLFYCDPPYIDACQGHYAGYTLEDYNALLDILSNIKGSFLMSHYHNHKVIIPNDSECFTFNASCSAMKGLSGNKDRKEIVYRKLNAIHSTTEEATKHKKSIA